MASDFRLNYKISGTYYALVFRNKGRLILYNFRALKLQNKGLELYKMADLDLKVILVTLSVKNGHIINFQKTLFFKMRLQTEHHRDIYS